MPDESCRTCGGELVRSSRCAECRKVTRWICLMCHLPTREQFHHDCLTLEPILVNAKNQSLLLEQHKTIKKSEIKSGHTKKAKLFVTILVSLAIGFFAIGFGTLDHFDPSYSAVNTTQSAGKSNIIHNPIVLNPITQSAHYDNCLAISDGKAMSVKCPTAYGYAYNAVLQIPQALTSLLHQKSFSLRGISLTENVNSILIQYEKKLYTTNYMG